MTTPRALATECATRRAAAIELRDRLIATAKPRTAWRRSPHAPAIKALDLAASAWGYAAAYYASDDPVANGLAAAEHQAAIERQAKADALVAEHPA